MPHEGGCHVATYNKENKVFGKLRQTGAFRECSPLKAENEGYGVAVKANMSRIHSALTCLRR